MLTIEQSDTLKLAVCDSVEYTLATLKELMNNPKADASSLTKTFSNLFILIDDLTENPNA